MSMFEFSFPTDKFSVPGDPNEVRATASKYSSFAKTASEAASGLRKLQAGDWTGSEGDQYRQSVSTLPKPLDDAHEAFSDVASALTSFARVLEEAQSRMGGELPKARAAWNAKESAHSDLQDHNAQSTFGTEPAADSREGQEFAREGTRLSQAVANANADWEHHKRIASGIKDDVEQEANKAAQKIREAAKKSPTADQNWLERHSERVKGSLEAKFRDLKGWIKDHAAAVRAIGTALKVIGTILVVAAAVIAVVAIVAAPFTGGTSLAALPVAMNVARVGFAAQAAGSAAQRAADWSEGKISDSDLIKGLAIDAATTYGGAKLAKYGAQGAKYVGEHAMKSPIAQKIAAKITNPTEFGKIWSAKQDAVMARLPKSITSCRDPLDVATGEMFLTMTDLDVPGVLPLTFTRTHKSEYREGGWFGPSWASMLDMRVQRFEVTDGEADAEPLQSFVLVQEEGALLRYDDVRAGKPAMPRRGPRWSLTVNEDATLVSVSNPTAHVIYDFVPVDAFWAERDIDDTSRPLDYRLARIRDGYDNSITIEYSISGLPLSLIHSGGTRVLIEHHVTLPRVTGLWMVTTDGSCQLDEATRVVAYDYDETGDLVAVRGSSDLPVEFAYDDDHRITRWRDTNKTHYTYTFDEHHRVVEVDGTAHALAGTLTYEPLPTGGMRTHVTNSLGGVDVFVTNADGRLTHHTDPLGNVTITEYDATGEYVAAITDPLGRRTEYTYDELGNVTSITRPDGHTERTEAHDGGRHLTYTHADGTTSSATFDHAGALVEITDATDVTTRYEYTSRGHLAAVYDPTGVATAVTCDPMGLPVQVVEPDGATTTLTRDAFGRPTTITNPDGHTTSVEWTIEGKPARVSDPTGATQTWTWDAEGNLRSHTNADGHTTTTGYTYFDLPATQTLPDGTTFTFTYDTELRLTHVTNPAGLTWTYTYNPCGHLVEETDFNGATTTYTHDAAGQITHRVNATGQHTAYTYSPLGLLTTLTADGLGEVTYTYDPTGNLIEAVTPDTHLTLARDAAGRVTAEALNGHALTHTLDRAGRPTRRVTPAGIESSYTYDTAGHLVGRTLAGRNITHTHTPAGLRATTTYPGTHVTSTHTPTGNLATQTITATDGASTNPFLPTSSQDMGVFAGALDHPGRLIQHRAYTYTPGGTLTGITTLTSGARHITLDALDRITTITGTASAPAMTSANSLATNTADHVLAQAAPALEAYTYDASGNLTTNNGHRLQVTGTLVTRHGHTSYTHDQAGRLVTRRVTRDSRPADVTRFTYNALDQLTHAVTPGGHTWAYTYDALGRRVRKTDTSTGQTWHYTWDGTTLVETTTNTHADGEGNTSPTNGVGSGAATNDLWVTTTVEHDHFNPIAHTITTHTKALHPEVTAADTSRPAGAENSGLPVKDWSQDQVDQAFYAIITEPTARPTELLTETGDLLWQQASRTIWDAPTTSTHPDTKTSHDTASNTPQSTATLDAYARTTVETYGYAGQHHDTETGLSYNHHRYYNPHTAAYTTPDPLGLAPAPNHHAYVPNPTTWIDPLGLALCDPKDPHPTIPGRSADGTFRGENGTAANGRRAHDQYTKLELAGPQNEGWNYNVALPGPSKLRPDAWRVKDGIVVIRELKPDSPSGRLRGASQTQEYESVMATLFPDHHITSSIDYYKP